MDALTAFLLLLAGAVLAFFATRLRLKRSDGDVAITAAINSAILGDLQFSTCQIDVKTFDGVVILGGFTHDFGQRKRAEELASEVPGVKSVDNRISIRSGH